MPMPPAHPSPLLPPAEGLALFIYYRVPQARVVAAQAALRQMFDVLQARWPGLQSRLYGRQDEASQDVTWMEVHQHPQGVHADCQEDVATQAQQWLTGLIGVRHIEVFAPLPLSDASGRTLGLA